MNTPEELRRWSNLIHDPESKNAPSASDIECALWDYAELLEDMQTLTRILNKWGP